VKIQTINFSSKEFKEHCPSEDFYHGYD